MPNTSGGVVQPPNEVAVESGGVYTIVIHQYAEVPQSVSQRAGVQEGLSFQKNYFVHVLSISMVNFLLFLTKKKKTDENTWYQMITAGRG